MLFRALPNRPHLSLQCFQLADGGDSIAGLGVGFESLIPAVGREGSEFDETFYVGLWSALELKRGKKYS